MEGLVSFWKEHPCRYIQLHWSLGYWISWEWCYWVSSMWKYLSFELVCVLWRSAQKGVCWKQQTCIETWEQNSFGQDVNCSAPSHILFLTHPSGVISPNSFCLSPTQPDCYHNLSFNSVNEATTLMSGHKGQGWDKYWHNECLFLSGQLQSIWWDCCSPMQYVIWVCNHPNHSSDIVMLVRCGDDTSKEVGKSVLKSDLSVV